ncbi:MAG TPA: protealysin inhibitor emfourin [Roseiflexaceae bacterium]|nr:protealysin inhibitor emfourin [Roseiflexaceae bacterium]
MRVELQTDGGVAYFPGLNKPVVVDSADLPKEQADKFDQLLEQARLFEQPAAPRSVPKGAVDMRRYTLTVQGGGRSRTVRLADPIEDPNLQALVDFLQDQRIAQARGSASSPPAKPQ